MSKSHCTNEDSPERIGYDDELQRHNDVLRLAVGVEPHDHVLDIGCGTGQTTRDAGRAAQAGTALGVDVSAPAIERARELASAERLSNVTFEHANAQVHSFPRDHFDVAMSRFGTMFFDSPTNAFANIRRALRPGGRLTMMVWQSHAHNEWDVAIHQALGADEEPAAPRSEGPDPCSLADPPTVKKILEAADFDDVTFTDLREPVYYGPNVATALAWVSGFTSTCEVLERLDPAAATLAVERLRDVLAAHASDEGIWFNSCAWIVTATRQ